jgi:prepilin-type N-terminal cleavage/methylation domain-containing protein
MNKLKRKVTLLPGFTLIELLIVIVIIGILAGVIIAVINPAQMQLKARQAVLRANTEKGCLALNACGATTSVAADCNSIAKVGIVDPGGTPTGATYALTAVDPIAFTGTLGTCNYTCSYNFANVTTASGPTPAAACLVQ